MRNWVRPAYGWDNPSWARPGGIKPEPWHFEFFAAGPVPDRAIDPTDVDTWTPATTTTSATDQTVTQFVGVLRCALRPGQGPRTR